MKPTKFIMASLLTIGLAAPAAVYPYASGTLDAAIPDGNLVGWSTTLDLSGSAMAGRITDVSVHLNLSGGYNGDLYAYISYGNVLVPLLNRPGVDSAHAFGYGDAGMNVTLSDGGAGNIHFYGGAGAPSGTWQPDGRAISPLSAPGAFDAAGALTFAQLAGMDPNGSWTLFIADVSAGGGQSVLNSWELDITAVPEPTSVALGLFAVSLFVGGLCRTDVVRRRWRLLAGTIGSAASPVVQLPAKGSSTRSPASAGI